MKKKTKNAFHNQGRQAFVEGMIKNCRRIENICLNKQNNKNSMLSEMKNLEPSKYVGYYH